MDPSLRVSVASLNNADKEGFLTKQGGSIRTWKRRWFVLKGMKIYYFKTRNDLEATGIIELEPDSFVKDEKDKKKRFMFSVGTSRRVFFIVADNEKDMISWIDSIKRNISGNAPTNNQPTPVTRSNEGASQPQSITPSPAAAGSGAPARTVTGFVASTTANASPRGRLAAAKNCIPYLMEETSKVLEFWQIWTESVPLLSDLQVGNTIEFHVATSADMQKLTWRTAGPQNIFIQKMVDFFWNVGAPESEIDRLNDVGALINPVKIGSWIDMSAKGGMDGGWFFPVEIPLDRAIEASDTGDPTRKVSEWARSNGVNLCFSVGRDMGAAPPRQTEIRLKLPGTDFNDQLRLAMDAFFVFGFPAIPDEALTLIRRSSSEANGPLCMAVITSSEGFVRLGLLIPKPSQEVVSGLSQLGGGSSDEIGKFQVALQSQGPTYAEYQYLMKGFGYGVYKEGFDIVFHYLVGEDHGE